MQIPDYLTTDGPFKHKGKAQSMGGGVLVEVGKSIKEYPTTAGQMIGNASELAGFMLLAKTDVELDVARESLIRVRRILSREVSNQNQTKE